jgi:predicted acyltransferase
MPDLPKNRLLSLDVFRGITIAGMILVNNPGSWAHVYPPLRHAEWDGWTPTDLIFPFFLFIVGVAMTYSFKFLSAGERPKGVYWKILRRTVILFGLGLFLQLIPIGAPAGYNWFSDTLAKLRVMGVLQRIAIVYFFASLIVLNFKPRAQAYWAIGLLVLYGALMKFVPFTVMENGAAQTYVGLLEKERNLAAYVDDSLLRGHTWHVGPYFHHDPEGFLSTIPAIATALIGVFAGYWLRSGKPNYETDAGLFFAGVCGLFLGSVLDAYFPINKWLWSPSYVIFMGGMALIFLATCHYLVDSKGYTRGVKPFVIFGTNAIALYVLAEVVTRLTLLIKVTKDQMSVKGWVYDKFCTPVLGNLNGSLVFAIVYVLMLLGVMAVFYKNKVFIKI